MATNYPGSIDTINQTNPTATSPRNSPSLAGKITDLSDAVVAIQTELGTIPSGASTTVAERFSESETFGLQGTLTVRVGKGRFPFTAAATILGVTAIVNTAPSGAAIIIDLNINGVTAYTTQANRPTIAAGANASTETVPDVTAIAAGDYLTVDIDQVGSTAAGADLTVVVRYRRT